MKTVTLRELIEHNIPLGRESATGFWAVRCAPCNDHSERAGFKFDGDIVGYSCFNCGRKAKFEDGKLSKSFRQILKTFGLADTQLDEVHGSTFFTKSSEPKEITLDTVKPKIKLYTPEVELPPHTHLLGVDHSDELQAPLIEYILKRGLDPLKLNACFSLEPKYLNHVIIPCIRDGRIIFWQARNIDPTAKPRYRSPSVDKTAVLWGYDELWKTPELPLFVTEGIFDAASIDGVALLGSALNDSKIEVLNRCKRRKIVVVDRDSNGALLANLALAHGWEITFPPQNSKDVNDSLQRNGRLLTVWTLLKNSTVPTGVKTTEGVTLQSKLTLEMQLLSKR